VTDRFERIYTEHRQGLFSLALAVTRCVDTAEDAVHEAFVRLCKRRSPISGDPVAYVFMAVRHAAIDQLRRRGRIAGSPQSIFSGDALPLRSTAPPPDDLAATAERDRLIRAALDQLPDAQREVIVMKLYAQLTFDQIAQVSGEPLWTITSRYRRGLNRLKTSVEVLR